MKSSILTLILCLLAPAVLAGPVEPPPSAKTNPGLVTALGTLFLKTRFTPENGWYWNAAESGRGFFFERRASGAVFFAGFQYESDGRATWFTAQGSLNGQVFTAPMTMFRGGQTLTGAYRPPQLTSSPGSVTLTFATPEIVDMTWPGGQVRLSRVPITASSTVLSPRPGAPESGWYWVAQESGRGFALEIQGNGLFLCGFMYDAAGNPIWYTAQGTLSSTNRYVGNLLQFRDGQAMGAPYRAPVLINPDAGAITIQFTPASTANLTLPDGRTINLTRFVFD